MRRKNLTSRIKSMTNERKVLAISSILTLAACFMPWYGINSRVINEWWNAFGSIGSVAGYLVFSFSLISLFLVTIPLLSASDSSIAKKLPFREASLHIFLQGQSFFIALVFIPVYSQYSLINATNSGTRFGLYVALLSTLVGTLFAIGFHRKAEQLQMSRESFASVPQSQRSLNEWDEEATESISSEEDIAQEEMFEDEDETLITAESTSFSSFERSSQEETKRFDPYQQ